MAANKALEPAGPRDRPIKRLTNSRRVAIRAAVNRWIGRSFPEHRSLLSHNQPTYSADEDAWAVDLVTKRNGSPSHPLGRLLVSDTAMIVSAPDLAGVLGLLRSIEDERVPPGVDRVAGDGWELRLGDGIEAASRFDAGSVDLLLTDPPYGISRRYTCESQIPRRLRPNGSDFIMPRGHFGDWDAEVDPRSWTQTVLPKVRGWAVTFCAQAQIGEYCDIFTDHGFVAVGPMVWQKTNPVPFNHQYKPINAWEAIVIGKRPGTAFNGRLVHNVFVHKSPSPQQRIHPTQKPLPLMGEFIELFSQPGGLVFDPFAGSATTVVAARERDRRVIGYEMDPEIFGLAVERLSVEQLALS